MTKIVPLVGTPDISARSMEGVVIIGTAILKSPILNQAPSNPLRSGCLLLSLYLVHSTVQSAYVCYPAECKKVSPRCRIGESPYQSSTLTILPLVLLLTLSRSALIGVFTTAYGTSEFSCYCTTTDIHDTTLKTVSFVLILRITSTLPTCCCPINHFVSLSLLLKLYGGNGSEIGRFWVALPSPLLMSLRRV